MNVTNYKIVILSITCKYIHMVNKETKPYIRRLIMLNKVVPDLDAAFIMRSLCSLDVQWQV